MSILELDIRKERFWMVHVLVGLFLGLALFAVVNSTFLLNQLATLFFGGTYLGERAGLQTAFLNVLIYGRDFLWGYTLTFAISWLFKGSREGIRRAAFIVFAFEIALEVWKWIIQAEMLFPMTSLIVMFAADLLVLLIIMIHERYLI